MMYRFSQKWAGRKSSGVAGVAEKKNEKIIRIGKNVEFPEAVRRLSEQKKKFFLSETISFYRDFFSLT